MGMTTGIRFRCSGPMVVGFSEGGSAARDAGLEPGDIITSVGGKPVSNNEELMQALNACPQGPITVDAERNGKPVSFRVEPASGADGPKIGAWVRDRMSGIGTITFVDPETGFFGSLGHAVCDVDTGVIMPVRDGSVIPSEVESVIKGKPGSPGELQGSFDLTGENGEISKNCEAGIMGKLNNEELYEDMDPMPWAEKEQIKEGPAVILANVDGSEVREYDVKIVKVYSGKRDDMRDMMIEVTDKNLISQTGGIVQGMSGSPIIQNGKIIGAVTHVCVNL